MLDMLAAFDMVDHQLLLKKLSYYGFEECVIKWISSYLKNRRQCVVINGALSKLLPVESGVPQGSILGPLLYTIFVNELPQTLQNSNASEVILDQETEKIDKLCCYADDSTLSSSD